VFNAKARPIYSQENHMAPFPQKAGWDLGPVWMGAENIASARIRFEFQFK
jgi:hypothetical protein